MGCGQEEFGGLLDVIYRIRLCSGPREFVGLVSRPLGPRHRRGTIVLTWRRDHGGDV